MRYCIVGGGILGLALARLIVRERAGRATSSCSRRSTTSALHQTGRNSGVVHAGLYYEPGSLKARLCRRGMGLLQAYCAERGIPYEACGKVVVATEEGELGRWRDPRAGDGQRRAGRALVDGARLRELEPHAAGIAALHSPHTAIVDFAAVARALAAEVARGRRGGPARRRGRARRDEPRRAAARRARGRDGRRGRRDRGLRRACTPTGSRAPPASRPTRASSPSAASTGRCGRSAPRWCAG